MQAPTITYTFPLDHQIADCNGDMTQAKPKAARHNTTSPMYVLGMICRHIWPVGALPNNIMEMMLSRPMTAIGMASRRPEMRQCDQDELAELMSRLPATFNDPKGGISEEDQLLFWIGYYHYLSALDHSQKFGVEHLRKCGEVLFGNQWQTDMAKALDLGDARRIRQWLSGDRKIPATMWADVAGLLRQRKILISSVLGDMEK